MPNQQGGRWRREKGQLTQVAAPPKEQRFGGHAKHPSAAPKPAPAKAPSSAKSSTNVKGKNDDSTTA